MRNKEGLREVLGRAIHKRYRRNQRGAKPTDDPAMQSWEDLPEHLRESNRQQADAMAQVLQRIGCGIRPASGAPEAVVFVPAEVEVMAETLHAQWVAERRAAGWVGGPVRDVESKVTPYLVPYAELTDAVKEWDRQAVRAFSEVLAEAGLEIYRLSQYAAH